MTIDGADVFLRQLFDVAVSHAHPANTLSQHLPDQPKGRVVIIGAGKAAAAMAKAVEDHWERSLSGAVVVPHGYGVPCRYIEVLEAGHPIPDERSECAARKMLDLARTADADDLVLCLISGGGSALMSLPALGLTLADKQTVTRALLLSGADISEINLVRRHLSGIKGGRLADAAFPARVVTLLVSDIPENDVSDIASGPTVADTSSAEEALKILARYDVAVSDQVTRHLQSREGRAKRHDTRGAVAEHRLIATPIGSLNAAADFARSRGVSPIVLGDALQGEAREIGKAMAGIALSVRTNGCPVNPPAVVLSGGETTVTVRGKGRGGRNTEFLSGLMLGLNGADDIYAIAADTDGIDGSGPNAGAIVRPDSLARSRMLGLHVRQHLYNNDSVSLFEALGDLVVSGPTQTNVNDFRAILVHEPQTRLAGATVGKNLLQ